MEERGQRPRLSVDARKAEILAVAVALTREVGLTGLTLSEIRARAGVSTGLVSHYFASLDGVRIAVFHEIFDTVESAVDASPTHRLASVIGEFASNDAVANARTWVDAVQLGRGNEAMRQAVLARMAADRDEMADIIRTGIRVGEFVGDDPERSARRILVVLDGYLMQFLVAEDREVRERLRRVVWDLAEREIGRAEGALRSLAQSGQQ